jgi:hypothetical protein
VTISVPSSLLPQETITAGTGARRVDGGILIFDILLPSFLTKLYVLHFIMDYKKLLGHYSQCIFLLFDENDEILRLNFDYIDYTVQKLYNIIRYAALLFFVNTHIFYHMLK